MRIAYPDYEIRKISGGMGIRGLFASGEYNANLKIMQSLAEQLRSKQDSGTLYAILVS